MSTISFELTTETPKDMKYLIDLANGPKTDAMISVWKEVVDHGIATGKIQVMSNVLLEIEKA